MAVRALANDMVLRTFLSGETWVASSFTSGTQDREAAPGQTRSSTSKRKAPAHGYTVAESMAAQPYIERIALESGAFSLVCRAVVGVPGPRTEIALQRRGDAAQVRRTTPLRSERQDISQFSLRWLPPSPATGLLSLPSAVIVGSAGGSSTACNDNEVK